MAGSITVDFSGVESYSGLRKGLYPVKIVKGVKKIGQKSEKPYIEWTFSAMDKDHKGQKIRHTTSLQTQSLFALRNLMVAAGIPVKEGKNKFQISTFIGQNLAVELGERKYTKPDGTEGKGNDVTSVMTMKEYLLRMKDHEAEDEDEDEEDEDEMEEEELEEEVDENEEDEDEEEEKSEPPKKTRSKKSKAPEKPAKGKKKKAKKEDIEDADEEDEDDDDLL